VDDAWLVQLQNRVDDLDREVKEGVRPRLHKLADAITTMQIVSREQRVLIDVLRQELKDLRETTATRVQVDAGVALMSAKLDSFHSENKLKIENITDQLNPMKNALYWAVGLLFTAVGAQVLNLVLRK
jgi:hypothetical protein